MPTAKKQPSNTALWDAVCVTDSQFTKGFNKGGFKGTAINSCWIIKKLTEQFGPCGVGWKFVIESECYRQGHSFMDKSGIAQHHKIFVIRGHIDYKYGGEWVSTGPQYGQTAIVGKYATGPFTDEEAPKKAASDCLSKCACLIGVGADVHLGRFDDNKWVNEPIGERDNQRPVTTAKDVTCYGPATLSCDPVATSDCVSLIATGGELLHSLEQLVAFEDYTDLAPDVKERLMGIVAVRTRDLCPPGDKNHTSIGDILSAQKTIIDSDIAKLQQICKT